MPREKRYYPQKLEFRRDFKVLRKIDVMGLSLRPEVQADIPAPSKQPHAGALAPDGHSVTVMFDFV
jgi:hypothetical protein